MKISGITVWQVDLPLKKPYWLSGGRLKFEVLDSTIVCIDTDAGIVGWGEGCPWGSTYLPGFGKGIRAGLAELAPQLIGHDPRQIAKINRFMDIALPGHPYVKSAVDIACWDILGKAMGLVCDLLGGRYDEPVPIVSSVSTGTPEEMLAIVQDYREAGYYVHSAQVGADVDLDIERIRFLMKNRVAGETFIFDVNRAWVPSQAIVVMNATRDLNITFEQPCETHEENAHVRRLTTQPIALDEGIKDFSDLLRAHVDGVCEMVNIKIGRVGGLSKARQMHDFCLSTGRAMLVMETGGSVLADTAAAHLAQSVQPEYMRGTWLCQEMLTVDTASGQGARNTNGATVPPQAPGLGADPDAAVLGEPLDVTPDRQFPAIMTRTVLSGIQNVVS